MSRSPDSRAPKNFLLPKILFGALGILGIAAIGLLETSPAGAVDSGLKVSYIDVGQGDSILLSDALGMDILIDGGRTSAGPTVVAYIENEGLDDIDYLIASHADADHIGGLIDVLEATDIPVDAVLYNGYPGDTATWNDFATAVANEGLVPTPIAFPSSFNWGEMTVYVLNPESGLLNPEQNDVSVVMLVAHGANTFLFTGDIDSTMEATIAARGTPMAADVLKVAHHGSAYSSSDSFLGDVQPTYAVISVGSNPYGHPAPETLDRLNNAGATILRTDELGTIVFLSDGITYSLISGTATPEHVLFLPLVMRDFSVPTEVPTSTPTPSPTNTPIPNVNITDIFYDGLEPYYEGDEYAVITNQGASSVNLSGWRLNAGDPGQDFYFPSYSIAPGESCRVYTDENYPEYCGFNFGNGNALWANGGDCGYLYNGQGALVSTYCY